VRARTEYDAIGVMRKFDGRWSSDTLSLLRCDPRRSARDRTVAAWRADAARDRVEPAFAIAASSALPFASSARRHRGDPREPAELHRLDGRMDSSSGFLALLL